MKKLSKENYQAAVQCIKSMARPLEQSLFSFEFEGGGKEAVLNELEKFQNKDGGFGNGLEPDFRCQESSAIATAVALLHLSRIKAEPSHQMVQMAFQYLNISYDNKTLGWAQVPKEVEEAPRAPWWNYKELNEDWGNPNAELIGFLLEFKQQPPFLQDLKAYAINRINSVENIEFHEVLSYIKLYERLPQEERIQMEIPLKRAVKCSVTYRSEAWDSYCLQPVQVDPAGINFTDKEVMDKNLSYLLSKQCPEGYWNPTWEWGQFEKEWPKARDEWRGILTLDYLRILKVYDRIER
ncbi:hypothetical protein [Peribacillus sp. SCS-155]|uniref:hypothetical protein n=1 Tax=Peribacillus sedimenti TaxID=3115297 RepID=UPI00390624D0